MRIGDVRRLWRASRFVHEGWGPAVWLRRTRFTMQGADAADTLAPLLGAPPGGFIANTVRGQPGLLAMFAAPYLNADWSAETRIARLADHLAVLHSVTPLDFPVDHSIELMPLEELGADYHLILDKPAWFHREGVVVLNLFRGNTRLFSLAFALERRQGQLVALIGGIQGRNLPNILDTYREITKESFGLRPRDLVIDLFRMLCRALGVTQILAVSDRCRHHRSTWFNQPVDRPLQLDYDEIWRERGGIEADGAFYAIPIARQTRDDADIPARKRAMYRRRYELLDAIEGRMPAAVRRAAPVLRPEAA